MADPRAITCPHCDTERTTKAGAGQRVSCPGCGRLFLVPRAGEVAGPAHAGASAAGEPAGNAGGDGSGDGSVDDPPPAPQPAPRAPTGATVRKADGVTIKQAAKPRAPRPTPEVEEEPPAEPVLEEPPRIPAAVSGRRGGLGSAFYRRRVRGG